MAFFLALIFFIGCVVLALAWFTALTARRVEAMLPPRGRFMDIDGQRIHYTDTGGSGPAVVLIHGLAGNMLNFNYTMPEKLAADFRVIAVDRPGSGYSTRPDDASATLAAQAATLATLFRQLELGRAILVGHSLGGALSLALALDHPDCVGGLALIAPLTHTVEKAPTEFNGLLIRSRVWRKIVAWTVATPGGILGGAKLLAFAFAPDVPPADFSTRGGGLLGLRPSNFYAASSDIVAVEDVLPGYMARYHALRNPMAMLYGRGDHLLDFRAQGEAMVEKNPALELELLEGGHMLPVTVPDRCVAIVRRVADRMKEAHISRAQDAF